MFVGKTILEKTNIVTGAIANAMTSVIGYLDGDVGNPGLQFGCKHEADLISMLRSDAFSYLGESLNYIRLNWNSIIQSDILKNDIVLFLRRCRDFRNTISVFDDCICRNLDDADNILDDCWIGRSYLVDFEDWRSRAMFAIEFARKNFIDNKCELGAFNGIVRNFRKYFIGVSDEEFRDFILYGKPLSSRPKWLGGRVEATLMGQELGLSCSDMNRSFLFVDSSGKPRKLKYSSDTVSMDRRYYEIHTALDSVRSAIELTGISH